MTATEHHSPAPAPRGDAAESVIRQLESDVVELMDQRDKLQQLVTQQAEEIEDINASIATDRMFWRRRNDRMEALLASAQQQAQASIQAAPRIRELREVIHESLCSSCNPDAGTGLTISHADTDKAAKAVADLLRRNREDQ